MINKKVLLLGFCIALTACSQEESNEEAPELMAPLLSSSSYFPVTYGVLDKTNAVLTTVRAMEYGQHFKKSVTVSEICVAIGDEVKEGDLLAIKDTKEQRKELEGLKNQLSEEEAAYELELNITNERIEQIRLLGDANASTQIAIEQENIEYERLMLEQRREELNTAIDKLQREIDDDKLYASASGIVTYIKAINHNPEASSTENVVVIADMNDTYLEPDILMSAYTNLKKKYDQYIILNGERHEVTELPYTADELTMAKYYDCTARVRLKCDIQDMKVGDNYYLYFVRPDKDKKLLVYSSSVYGDGNHYVYVSNNGDDEKRYVEVGKSDGWYTEILSGLSEGDLVAFSSDSLIPSKNEVVVIQEDVTLMNHSDSCFAADLGDRIISSSLEGRIIDTSELFAAKVFPVSVNEGDYLYTIDLGISNAQIRERELELERAKADYEKTNNGYNKQLEELNKELNAAGDSKQREYYQHEQNIISMEMQSVLETMQKRIDTAAMEYEKAKGDDESPGIRRVYAAQTGVIKDVYVKEGEYINIWDNVYAVATPSKQIRVVMSGLGGGSGAYCDTENIADLMEKISFKARQFGDAEYYGTCVGYYGSSLNIGKPYFDSEGDELHISFNCEAGYMEPGFYVELDEDSMEMLEHDTTKLRASFPAASLKGMIVLRRECIQDIKTNSPYVWVKKDGYTYKRRISIENKYGNELDGVLVVSGLSEGEVVVY